MASTCTAVFVRRVGTAFRITLATPRPAQTPAIERLPWVAHGDGPVVSRDQWEAAS